MTKLRLNMTELLGSLQLSPAKARILCDYIAGMTDGFAIRTYKRLFDPHFGSILDLGR